MSLRDIIVVAHPVLRKKARKVGKVTPDIGALLDDMVETMRHAPGVGLAAPQIGVSKRVIVVEYAEGEEKDAPEGQAASPPKKKLYAVVNPELTYASEDMLEGAEGCLSIPGWMGLVDRHRAVGVKGLDRNGRPFRLQAEGWLARIFQHEIDHLDGVLFTDRVKSPDNLWRTPPAEEAAESHAEAQAAKLG